MKFHILNVSANRLDEFSLSITLDLQPNFWEKYLQKIPSGKVTFIGYERQWYADADYKPAAKVIVDILFEISYDRAYRHLQPKDHLG